MEYLLSFLEGIITFISPCLLPMLPIYITYFAGQTTENRKHSTVKNAAGFVLGFSILFIVLGAFAGQLGTILKQHTTIVNVISGAVIILFGLNYIGMIRIPFLNQTKQLGSKHKMTGFLSAVLFGLVFSVSWTPCVGTFLGSALMLAANSGSSSKGILLLLSFSLGLGLPFMLSAVLIQRLKTAFDFIKKHYRIINTVSGVLLVLLGVLLATGLLNFLYQ